MKVGRYIVELQGEHMAYVSPRAEPTVRYTVTDHGCSCGRYDQRGSCSHIAAVKQALLRVTIEAMRTGVI